MQPTSLSSGEGADVAPWRPWLGATVETAFQACRHGQQGFILIVNLPV